MITALWAKFGKWIGAALAVLGAIAAAVLYGMHRGAAHQIERAAIDNAKAATQAAQQAQATLADASAAAQQVQQAAAAQAPPDATGRTDFENTF